MCISTFYLDSQRGHNHHHLHLAVPQASPSSEQDTLEEEGVVFVCVCVCVCLVHQDVLLHTEDESSVGSQIEILILHHIIHLHQLTNVCVCMFRSVHMGVCMWVRMCGIWGTVIAIPILCLIVYCIPAFDSQNVWRYEI